MISPEKPVVNYPDQILGSLVDSCFGRGPMKSPVEINEIKDKKIYSGVRNCYVCWGAWGRIKNVLLYKFIAFGGLWFVGCDTSHRFVICGLLKPRPRVPGLSSCRAFARRKLIGHLWLIFIAPAFF